MKFNWLDLVLMLIAFRGVYTGYKRGIISETVFLGGSIASFICAFKYAGILGERLIEKISIDSETAYLFCFLSVVFGGILLALIVASLVRKLVRMVIEIFIEKFLGALLGVLRALLFGGVFMIYVLVEFPAFQTHVDDSALGGYLEQSIQKCSLWTRELAGVEVEDEKLPTDEEEISTDEVEIEDEEVTDQTESETGKEGQIPWM